MKQIKLTKGQFALVDDEDYVWLSRWRWHTRVAKHTNYAARSVSGVDGKQRDLKMHRAILKVEQGYDIDHKDRNGLNNQRNNLRQCTKSENCYNRSKHPSNTSGYRGVSWRAQRNRWKAQINVDGAQIHIGSYFCIIKAARAYDEAAKKHHREFAQLNF